MGENIHTDFPPRKINIGMMADLFGDFPDLICKIERFLEIFKLKTLFEVMVLGNLPSLAEFFLEFRYPIWRESFPVIARLAFFGSKFIHSPSFESLYSQSPFRPPRGGKSKLPVFQGVAIEARGEARS